MSEHDASEHSEDQSFIDFDDAEHADEVPLPVGSPHSQLSEIDKGDESDRSLDSLSALQSRSPFKEKVSTPVALS